MGKQVMIVPCDKDHPLATRNTVGEKYQRGRVGIGTIGEVRPCNLPPIRLEKGTSP